jgi:hypothetical protein
LQRETTVAKGEKWLESACTSEDRVGQDLCTEVEVPDLPGVPGTTDQVKTRQRFFIGPVVASAKSLVVDLVPWRGLIGQLDSSGHKQRKLLIKQA